MSHQTSSVPLSLRSSGSNVWNVGEARPRSTRRKEVSGDHQVAVQLLLTANGHDREQEQWNPRLIRVPSDTTGLLPRVNGDAGSKAGPKNVSGEHVIWMYRRLNVPVSTMSLRSYGFRRDPSTT